MSFLGDLLVRLKLDSADFSAGFDKAAKTTEKGFEGMRHAAEAFGIGLSAAGIVELTRRSIDFGDKLNDISKTTSISVETLAGLSVAAKQSGSDLEGMAAAVSKLSVNFGKNEEKFKALGITARDPIERLKQLADIYNGLEDPALRAAVAQTAMGKSWQSTAPLLAEGSKKIGELIEQGTKYSGMTSDIAQASDDFNDKLTLLISTGSLMSEVANQALPILNMLADDLLAGRDAAKGMTEEFNPLLETMKAILVVGSDVHFVLDTFGKDMARAALNVQLILSGQWKASRELGAAVAEDAKKARAELDAWQKKIMDVNTVRKAAKGGGLDARDLQLSAGYGKAMEKNEAAKHSAEAAALAKKAQAFVKTENAALALQKRENAAIQQMEEKRKSLFDLTEEQLMQERTQVQTLTLEDGTVVKLAGSYSDFHENVKNFLVTRAKELDARKQNIDRIQAEFAALRAVYEQMEKQNDLVADRQKSNRDQAEDMRFEIDMMGKSRQAQERATAARNIDLQTRQRIAARIAALGDDPWPEQVNGIIKAETEAAEKQKKIVDGMIEERQQKERSWAYGTQEAFQIYIDNATNAAENARMLFTNAFQSMEDALVNFVKTGKLDFKSLADSIISDIIRIQIRAQLAKIFDPKGGGIGGGIFDGGGGGFDIGGIVGKFFGGGGGADLSVSAASDALAAGDLFDLPFFANGGDINGPAIVGERGPELFVPDVGGKIMPNYQLGGGGNTYVIDARGADIGVEARLTRALYALAGPGVVERRAIRASNEARKR